MPEADELTGEDRRAESLKIIEQKLRERPGFLLRRCPQDTSSTFENGCSEVGITMRQYDYLFVLARKIAKDVGVEEVRWQARDSD